MPLTPAQCEHFLDLYDSLFFYVNEAFDVLGEDYDPFDIDRADEQGLVIADYLFNPQGEGHSNGAIDAYLEDNPDLLPAEDLEQIAQWRDGGIQANFFVVRSTPGQHTFMANGTLFEVPGLEPELPALMCEAPSATIATLLPFEGHIVYAGCPAFFDIDPASELGERLLREERKLRSGGHVVTCAADLVREAPLFRARHDLEYSRCMDLLAPLLVANLLGCDPSELGGKDDPMAQVNEFFDDLEAFLDEYRNADSAPQDEIDALLNRFREIGATYPDAFKDLANDLADFLADDFDDELYDEFLDDLYGDDDDYDEDFDDFDDFEEGYVPTHAGALAGMTPEERKAAVDSHIASETPWPIDEMQRCVEGGIFRHAPVKTLPEALGLCTKQKLYDTTRSFDLSGCSKMNKTQLVQRLTDYLMSQRSTAAESFARSLHAGMFDQAKRVWSLGGRLEMTREEYDAMPSQERPRAYVPLMNLFEHDGVITCCIPDEIMEVLGEQWESAAENIKRVGHARHLVDVYTDLWGIVNVRQLFGIYARYYPAEFTEDEFYDFILHDGPDAFSGYDLWTYRGELYLLHVLLLGREELSRNPIGGLHLDGDRMRKVTDAEDFRRYVLECREESEPWEVPAKTAEELEAFNPYRTIMAMPSCRAFQAFLDAHVPEGKSDYYFADRLIEDMTILARLSYPEDAFADQLKRNGLLLDGGEELRHLVNLMVALINDVPCWLDYGWCPNDYPEDEEEEE